MYVTIGERLLIERHRANMTKKELAKKAGIAVSTLTRYEKGETLINADKLERICGVLQLNIDDVVIDKAREADGRFYKIFPEDAEADEG